MNATEQDLALLIAEAAQQGISLSINGGKLKVSGNGESIQEWMTTLTECKPAILDYLRQRPQHPGFNRLKRKLHHKPTIGGFQAVDKDGLR